MSEGENFNFKIGDQEEWSDRPIVHEDGTVELDTASQILCSMNDLLRRRVYLCGDSITCIDDVIFHKVRPLLDDMTSYDKALFNHLSRWANVMMKRFSDDE